MYRYFIHLAYKGTNFHGWQVQDNAHTVQAEINEKLSHLLGAHINVVGCGRTDTGVHARQFYAHVDTENRLQDTSELCFRLNGYLGSDIVIYEIFRVKPDFHARFSAVSRTYHYYVSRVKDPFRLGQAYIYIAPLDIAAMRKGLEYLYDYNDFTSFSKIHTQTATNLCRIISVELVEDGHLLILKITADRFLRNMVRAIMGTLMEIGTGKLTALDMKHVIEVKNRSAAGFSVPAEGLFLQAVSYDFSAALIAV